MEHQVPDTPSTHHVYDWISAPWHHIKGALKRDLRDFDPGSYDTVDEAELQLDAIDFLNMLSPSM
jgi:hypothetical protein